jgi:hypothetical protein
LDFVNGFGDWEKTQHMDCRKHSAWRYAHQLCDHKAFLIFPFKKPPDALASSGRDKKYTQTPTRNFISSD